jgi:hypothetical protein
LVYLMYNLAFYSGQQSLSSLGTPSEWNLLSSCGPAFFAVCFFPRLPSDGQNRTYSALAALPSSKCASSLVFPLTDRIDSEVTDRSNPLCFDCYQPTGRWVILARKPLSRKAISDNKVLTSYVIIIKPFCPIPAIAASPPCVLATWSFPGPTVV